MKKNKWYDQFEINWAVFFIAVLTGVLMYIMVFSAIVLIKVIFNIAQL